jgi:hypothetical protein
MLQPARLEQISLTTQAAQAACIQLLTNTGDRDSA